MRHGGLPGSIHGLPCGTYGACQGECRRSRNFFIATYTCSSTIPFPSRFPVSIVLLRLLVFCCRRLGAITLKRLEAQRARLEKAREYLDEINEKEKEFKAIAAKGEMTPEDARRGRELLDYMRELHAHACWLLLVGEKDDQRRKALMANIMRAPDLGMLPMEKEKACEREQEQT